MLPPFLAGLVLLVCVLSQSTTAQHAPAWPAANGNDNDGAASARSSPLRFIAQLAHMPPAAQRVYLAIVGEQLKQKANMPCNIFGGESSCMMLPSDSEFARVCPEHNLKVDCAYYNDDLQEVKNNPVEEIRDALRRNSSSGLEESCPQCFDNMRRMWCAQTAPQCGSFQGAVEGAVLPAITTVLTAADNGRTPLDALSEAVPNLLTASNLALPCREMCESVISTCSCGKERKFGFLLKKIDAAIHESATGLPPIPKGFTRQLFGGLYKQPLCSLYAPSNATGFTGTCDLDLPKECTYQRRWCGQDDGQSNAGSALVEELMALQIAKGLFGWVDSIWSDENEVIDTADDKQLEKLQDKYLKHAKPKGEGGMITSQVIAITLCIVAVVTIIAVGVWKLPAWRAEQERKQRWAAADEELSGPEYDLLEPVYRPSDDS